jgi:uridine phosphorylase
MFPLLPGERPEVATERERLAGLGVLATDMETAALLTVAHRMGLAAASLCLGTVDAASQEKLSSDDLAAGEADLFRASLDGIACFLQQRGQSTP